MLLRSIELPIGAIYSICGHPIALVLAEICIWKNLLGILVCSYLQGLSGSADYSMVVTITKLNPPLPTKHVVNPAWT